MENIIWFNRPGIASALTPKAGTVQEWMTSAPVVITRIWVLRGSTTELSVSNKRANNLESSLGTIYESNSRFGKSEYSYDQYHWWPIALIVRLGLNGSSSR